MSHRFLPVFGLLLSACSSASDESTSTDALTFPAGNLVGNASFETSTSGWTSWQGTVTRVKLTGAPDGAYVARAHYGGTGGMYSLGVSSPLVASVPGGASYTATGWVRAGNAASVGRPATLILRERDTSGNVIKLWSSATKALTTAFQSLAVTASATQPGEQLDVYLLQDQALVGDAFYADAFSVVALDTFGLLPNGLRDKLLWPFASSSIWNTPIGSGAAYQAANIVANMGGGYPTFFYQDEDVVVMKPSSPSLNVYYSNVGWGGGNRCTPQGTTPLTAVPVPASYTLPNSGDNNSAAFLLADARTVRQNQPFTRCTANGAATTLATFPANDIYGAGNGGAHGGSGLSALGGTIRLGELRSGRIHHAMKIDMWAAQYYDCCSPHWPATTVDGYADGKTYGGTNPNLGPGSLLALLPSFDVSSLKTTPGKILAQGFIDYGAYAVDDTYSNGWAIATEQGPDGRVVDEFASLYGFAMRPAQTDPFMADVKTIFQALHIVTNNTATTIGGGGTPRVPVAPVIGN